jgi:hypothetical protein
MSRSQADKHYLTNASSSKGVLTHNLLNLPALVSSGKFGVKAKRWK